MSDEASRNAGCESRAPVSRFPGRRRLPPAKSRGRSSLALAAALLVALGCSRARAPFTVAAADPATRRSTASGDVVGGEGRYGAHAWLGVPYAAPPVGERRWRAPEPPARWEGVRPALAPGAPCAQFASPFGGVPDAPTGTPVGQEDCLTLAVWAPRFSPGDVPRDAARLPVMVWIHGGGNTIGQTAFYDGGHLAAKHGVIVVAPQYRLGPFGWLRHSALRAGATSDAERSGNFATLDLARALEWVRDNAASFGGDPGNVTVFGESAGGQNVFTLLLAPQARGLFQRAIAQSGGTWTSTPEEAERLRDATPPGHVQSSGEIVLRLLQRDGQASDRAAAEARLAAMSDAEVAAYLRSKSTTEILGAYEPSRATGMIDMPRAFADGAVLPAGDALEALGRSDGHAHVPVVLGTNRDENKLFLFADPAHVRRRLWVLPRFVDQPRTLASARALSRMWKATGADEPAGRLGASQDEPVYVYRFDWDEEPHVLGADLAAMLGAAHGFEIPFVFGHFDLGREGNVIFTEDNAPDREALSEAMMSYWAEFARSGVPGRGRGGDLPEWQPRSSAGAGSSGTLLLDTATGGGIRMAPVAETRAGVLASVDSDPELATQRDRCRVYHDLAQWSHALAKSDYPRAGQAGCAEFPYDEYPWDG